MTQKRGLGRGLGALIPGASGTSSTTPRDRAPSEDAAPLRTREPRPEPAPQDDAAPAVRPVDMFFSGDPAGAVSGGHARTRNGRDLADSMARDVAERRASQAASRRRAAKGGTAASKAAAAADAPAPDPVGTVSTEAAGTAPGRAGSASGKTTAEESAPATASSSGTGSSRKAAPKKRTRASASTGRARSASGSGAKPSPAAEEATDSAAVEIEAVVPEPARRTRTRADDEQAATVSSPDETASAPEPSGDDEAAAGSVETEDRAGTAADAVDGDAASGDDRPAASEPEDAASSGSSSTSDDALLPVPGAEFAEIPIHEIRENPRNPRTVFDDDALDELAYSLREVGVLQPVVVRPIPATDEGESFELVMGERRWRAARRAGLASIPAIIRETSDDDLLRDALLENLHRSQLNPLEEAAAYQQLLEDFGCTQEELADRIGRSRPQITNTLRLMKLPPLVQRRLASGALSAGHSRALLGLDSPALMEELAQRIVAEGLSVRAVERLVARGIEPERARTTPRRSSYDPHVVDLTSRLSNRLEAPVRIDVGKRKGRITLEFTNLEDLERLMERIGLEADDDQDGAFSSEG